MGGKNLNALNLIDYNGNNGMGIAGGSPGNVVENDVINLNALTACCSPGRRESRSCTARSRLTESGASSTRAAVTTTPTTRWRITSVARSATESSFFGSRAAGSFLVARELFSSERCQPRATFGNIMLEVLPCTNHAGVLP